MKILVTGAGGFLASHLVPALIETEKHTVIGGDKDQANVIRGFKAPGDVDLVIHLAANTSSKLAEENPRLDFETNVIGTFNILEYCREVGAKIIYPTTYKTERDATGKRSPYGLSKYVAEEYVSEWAKSFEVPAFIPKFSNLYGPRGDKFFVNKFAMAAAKGDPVEIWGTGKQKRQVLHVDDAVRLLLDVVDNFEKYQSPDPLNAGGGMENHVSINEIVKHLGIENVSYKDALIGDKDELVIDNSEITQEYGWAPRIHWEKGISELKKHYENKDKKDEASS